MADYPWEEGYYTDIPPQPPMARAEYIMPGEEEQQQPLSPDEVIPPPPPEWQRYAIPQAAPPPESPERSQERTLGGTAGFNLPQGTRDEGGYAGPEGVTNVPDQARQWRGEGKRVQYIADNPQRAAEGRQQGLDKDYPMAESKTSRTPPPKPDEGEVSRFQKFEGMWDAYVKKQSNWNGDPLKWNEGEWNLNMENEVDRRYDDHYAGQHLTPAQWADVEKSKNLDKKNNLAAFKAYQSQAATAKSHLQHFFDKEETERVQHERDKEIMERQHLNQMAQDARQQKGIDQQIAHQNALFDQQLKMERLKEGKANGVKEMQAYNALKGFQKDISNFELPEDISEDDITAVKAGTKPPPPGTRVNAVKLAQLNSILIDAGLLPMEEIIGKPSETTPTWGWGLFGGKTTPPTYKLKGGTKAPKTPEGGGNPLAGRPKGYYRVNGKVVRWGG